MEYRKNWRTAIYSQRKPSPSRKREGMQRPPVYANGTSHRSFPSSSEDSYGRLNSHSRSESGTSQTQYDDVYATPPSSKTLVQEFSRLEHLTNGHTLHNGRDYRKSLRLRQSDPMSMHLLLETALGDSQHYDLLTPDELEDLKQEEQMLSRKIKARRKKLFLESRMHNTSRSLQRLDSHSRNGSTASAHGPLTSQKCDELAEDLWRMERRQVDLKDRRLKHTAGVLQLNYQLQSQNPVDGYDDADGDMTLLDGALDLPGRQDHLIPRLQEISTTLYEVIRSSSVNSNLDFPEPPDSQNIDDEIEYIHHSLNTFRGLYEGLLKYLDEARQKGRLLDQDSQQTNAVLGGLWEIIGAGEEDLKRNKQANRSLGGNDETDVSDDEDATQENFSLQAFSAKVQRLCNGAVQLSEQQTALQQQWRQEREAQQQAESGRVSERSRLVNDTQEAHDKHLAGERALQNIKSELMDAKGRHDQAQQEIDFMKQQREMSDNEGLSAEREARRAVEAKHKDTEAKLSEYMAAADTASRELVRLGAEKDDLTAQLAALTAQVHAAEARASEHESAVGERQRQLSRLGNERQDMDAQLAVLSVNLETAQHRAEQSEAEVAAKQAQVEKAEAERAQAEAELVRLQTELTVSRAELDGAYGTRAQRAAEGAMTPEVKREIEGMRTALGGKESRVEALERELGELVTAHEGMVRQIVDAEKEREQLEGLVDQMREKIDYSERQLTDERVKTMGFGTPVSSKSRTLSGDISSPRPTSSRGGDSTSVGVMRNEFKRMMREMRSEHFKSLKVSRLSSSIVIK